MIDEDVLGAPRLRAAVPLAHVRLDRSGIRLLTAAGRLAPQPTAPGKAVGDGEALRLGVGLDLALVERAAALRPHARLRA